MARQNKKRASGICPLKWKVLCGLVTYFNKIKYDQHTDVLFFFFNIYNLKYVCYEINNLTKARKQNLKDRRGTNGRNLHN